MGKCCKGSMDSMLMLLITAHEEKEELFRAVYPFVCGRPHPAPRVGP